MRRKRCRLGVHRFELATGALLAIYLVMLVR
jgi:hypothetical protein